MTFALSEIGLKTPHKILNVWTGETIKASKGILTTAVPRHGVVLYRISP